MGHHKVTPFDNLVDENRDEKKKRKKKTRIFTSAHSLEWSYQFFPIGNLFIALLAGLYQCYRKNYTTFILITNSTFL